MPKGIRVMVLDNHQGTIDLYCQYLAGASDIEVVGAIHYGEDLEAGLVSHSANVLLFDVNVPTAPENPRCYPILSIIPKLLQKYPELVVLAITMDTGRAMVRAVMEAGARGYIMKDDQPMVTKLGVVIRAVVRGGKLLSHSAQQFLYSLHTTCLPSPANVVDSPPEASQLS